MLRRIGSVASTPLGGDAGRLGLDFGDQVAAELAAGRVPGKFRAALRRRFARRDQIAFLLQHARLAFHGASAAMSKSPSWRG